MRRALTLAVIVLVLAACSSSSSGVSLPDWAGWARYEQSTRSPDVPRAQIIAIGRREQLDHCDLEGSKAAFGTAGTDRIEAAWFFMCGEGYARKAVVGSEAPAATVSAALDDLDQLTRVYGKH